MHNTGRPDLRRASRRHNLDFTPTSHLPTCLASGRANWKRQAFELNALSSTDLDMSLDGGAGEDRRLRKLGRKASDVERKFERRALLALFSVGEGLRSMAARRGSSDSRSTGRRPSRHSFQFTDVDMQALRQRIVRRPQIKWPHAGQSQRSRWWPRARARLACVIDRGKPLPDRP